MTDSEQTRCILLVEDSDADVELILRYLNTLQRTFRVVVARTAADGLARIADYAPDIVLLDFAMPDGDGIEFLEDLNSMTEPDRLPPAVVMITGQQDARIAAALMRLGATDYIAKTDIDTERLESAVYVAIRTLEVREQLARRTREHADAVRALEAAFARAHFLSGVSAALLQALDPSAVLETIVRLAVPYLAVVCAVDVAADDAVRTRRTAAGGVVREGFDHHLFTDLETATMEMTFDGRAIGELTFASTHAWDAETQATADEFVRRASTALVHARAFAQVREIAGQLQRSLLPAELPIVPGIELAASYFAGAVGVEVGGDWYDVVALPGGKVAVVIGDVAGRGILAAAVMGQLRSSLRAYLLDGLEPSDALARLNGFMLSQERHGFATVGVGLFDVGSGVLKYASAGHLPPLVLDGVVDGRLLSVASSLPVGVLPDAVYEQSEARLTAGDTLVLYTDGLIESRQRGLDAGFAQLLATARSANADPDLLRAALLAGMNVARSDDDVTLLVMRYAHDDGDRTPSARGSVGTLGITYPAMAASAPPARRRLGAYLTTHGVNAERSDDVLTATGEAVANAVEHAYSGGMLAGIFTLRAHTAVGELTVDVVDHGAWRRRGTSVREPLDDRGRGFLIMEALADNVRVRHDATGTAVRLTFAL